MESKEVLRQHHTPANSSGTFHHSALDTLLTNSRPTRPRIMSNRSERDDDNTTHTTRPRAIKTESAAFTSLATSATSSPVCRGTWNYQLPGFLPSRKRPRTFSPSVGPLEGTTPATGFKMDLHTPGAKPSVVNQPGKCPTRSSSSAMQGADAPASGVSARILAQSEALRAQEIAQFLRRCNLSITNTSSSASSSLTSEPMASMVTRVATNLVKNGFDNMMALSFISHRELLECGLQDPMDQEAVFQQARRGFDHAAFRGPGAFKLGGDPQRQQVAEWIRECGIADPDAQHYAMKLFHQGYYTTEDLRLILHDKDSLRLFKVGHLRLFVHCVQAALQETADSSCNVSPLPMTSTAQPTTATTVPVTPTLASLEQSYLETLLQPTPIGRQSRPMLTTPGSSPWVSSIAIQDAAPQPLLPATGPAARASQALSQPYGAPPPPSFFHSRAPAPMSQAASSAMVPATSFKPAVVAPPMAHSPMAQLDNTTTTPQYVNLMNEAMTFPTLISPMGRPQRASSELWTEENIALLEKAVADPRCRHLSKVRWEVLANGATGSDEYAPLANFSASQLRSRYRSLFGDKRPERVRERKQMLKRKLEQQQQQEREQGREQERERDKQ